MATEVAAASTRRGVLASRIANTTPHFWDHAAESAGVSGADAFLLHLGRSITAALQAVAESAEAARTKLRETRAALHAAIDERCDALMANIDSAEASKTTALERELVSVDAALERWRAESAAVRDAVSTLSDADLKEQHATLSSRFDDLEAQLQSLPTAVVEPPSVGLLADTPALLASIAGFGRVLAPLPVTAADLSLEGVPSRVKPGGILLLKLSLSARHAAQSAEELEVSLGRLPQEFRVDATVVVVEEPGRARVQPQWLQTTVAPDASQRCLIVSIEACSPYVGGSASLHIGSMHVAGQPVSGLPLCVPVVRGVAPPFVLPCRTAANDYTTPCITSVGQIYCPPGDGFDVEVFDAEGRPLPDLFVDSIGLTDNTSWAAYAHSDTPCLLLADWNFGSTASRLVAVDPATHAVRWATEMRSPNNGYLGIAALPSLGVAVVSTFDSLVIHRLTDGVNLGGLKVPGLGFFLTADDATGAVYGVICSGAEYRVQVWHFAAEKASIRMASNGPATSAGSRGDPRPLAIVPPAPGKTTSHLVVGTGNLSELLVISLPGLALVHTHCLEGMEVTGLAADPWGGALAVCDRLSQSLHVLAWPLPGMPPLE